MKYIFKTLVALLLISFNVAAQRPALTVPDFTFFRINKSPFSNQDLEQNKILFFVFFDVSCDHCQRAMQTLNNRYSELKNTTLYLISLDSEETIKSFIDKYGKNLLNKKNVIFLQDLHNEFISKFQPKKYPSMFLYSPEKKLMMYNDNEQTLFRFFQAINKPARSIFHD